MGGEPNPMTRATITMFALLLAAAGACTTTLAPEPTSPTFAKDVQPILAAHCTRCHGGSGALVNEVDGSRQGIIDCYLDQYADRGDCTTPVDGGMPLPSQCMPGAKYCASPLPTPPGSPPSTTSLFDVYVFGPAAIANPMPPPPAAPLNDWEMNTLKRWAANGAPP
jgi:hypothetical protein